MKANLKQAVFRQQFEDEKHKRQFAQLYLKLGDPYKAAFELCGDNTSMAIQIGSEWPNDPVVIDYKNEGLLRRDGTDDLPTKADLARLVWDRMQQPMTSDEDFVKLAKTYADVMGYIEKPDTQINVNQQRTVNVLRLPAQVSVDDFEVKALAQQRRLANDARKSN